jgi:hypothetical protein
MATMNGAVQTGRKLTDGVSVIEDATLVKQIKTTSLQKKEEHMHACTHHVLRANQTTKGQWCPHGETE